MSRTEPRAAGPLRILLVDDNPDDRALVRRMLSRNHPGAQVAEVIDQAGLDRALDEGAFDLTITDYQLLWTNGLLVLRAAKARRPDRPVIMFTGTGSEEIAVEAMKGGLDDYVLKSPKHLVRLSTSITGCIERARDRAAARIAEETLHSLKQAVDTISIGVTIADTAGHIVYTNAAEARIHGYDVADLIGREARILVPSEFSRPLTAERIRSMRPWKRERINVRKDGSTFPAQLISDVVRTPAGDPAGIVTICEDITDRKAMEEQLRRNAFYDTLTGLPNRALFMDRLSQAVDRAKRHRDSLYAVLFLDLDRFKLVNDSFGHGVGDQLLVETARRLEASLRPSDTVARLGGDEFAILAEEVQDATDAVHIAQRAQGELGLPVRLEGREIFTSASIGIAVGGPRYADADAVLRDADSAMYRAKARGKARYEIFDEEMLADARGLLLLDSELRRALQRREFLLYYQPIVALNSGEIIGAEALLRWQHPERGLLLPEEFLDVAEETGILAPLSEWIMWEACARARDWHRNGLRGLRVSVNLSPRQFRRGGVPSLVRRALDLSGLSSHLLDLELTESSLMENVGETVRSLDELKDLGVRISVDDFGTGYSSLSYLKRFPVDTLKIDQSFVGNITNDPRDAAIVSSVVSLAHSLNLRVVAEGVETSAQADFLRRERCEAMQGFVFSRPLPPEAFEGLVRAA